MDSQFTATREELYHVQMDVKHVQAVQINHADRLLRLEKRQADDAALKSVWGTGSPFPGVLSGTPQQGKSISDIRKLKSTNNSVQQARSRIRPQMSSMTLMMSKETIYLEVYN